MWLELRKALQAWNDQGGQSPAPEKSMGQGQGGGVVADRGGGGFHCRCSGCSLSQRDRGWRPTEGSSCAMALFGRVERENGAPVGSSAARCKLGTSGCSPCSLTTLSTAAVLPRALLSCTCVFARSVTVQLVTSLVKHFSETWTIT